MIYSIELTEHHTVIKKLIASKIPHAVIYDGDGNILDVFRFIKKIKKNDELLINTLKHDMKMLAVIAYAKLNGIKLIIGIHCANQFLSKEYIAFNLYRKRSSNQIKSALKYIIFMLVNGCINYFIKKNFNLIGYSKEVNDYMRKNKLNLSDLNKYFSKSELVRINISSVTGEKNLILYGRLDEQRIDSEKFKALLKIVDKNKNLKLKIISSIEIYELRMLKDSKNIHIKIIQNYSYEWLVKSILAADYIVDINKKEKFIRALNYEKYGETIVSGLTIDAGLTNKEIINV